MDTGCIDCGMDRRLNNAGRCNDCYFNHMAVSEGYYCDHCGNVNEIEAVKQRWLCPACI